MPGPSNSKKAKKRQSEKEKARSKRSILKDVEQNLLVTCPVIAADEQQARSPRLQARTTSDPISSSNALTLESEISRGSQHFHDLADDHASPSALDNPFIVNPGNGPRVKDTETFLSSFFCPPVSLSDRTCAQFARDEILTVLSAVLPRELALIVWYNKTRDIDRICPACQRLYRVGDSLVDPISGELVNMDNPETPPQVFREQLLSGICSFPCFFLASYSSHPYTTEVARGAWGLLYDDLHAQTRSLLDATDPSTAAILRYGFAALTPTMTEGLQAGSDERGLGRAMRMTRKKDLGLGEVLEALTWYEREGQKSAMGGQMGDYIGRR